MADRTGDVFNTYEVLKYLAGVWSWPVEQSLRTERMAFRTSFKLTGLKWNELLASGSWSMFSLRRDLFALTLLRLVEIWSITLLGQILAGRNFLDIKNSRNFFISQGINFANSLIINFSRWFSFAIQRFFQNFTGVFLHFSAA